MLLALRFSGVVYRLLISDDVGLDILFTTAGLKVEVVKIWLLYDFGNLERIRL